MSTLLDYDDLCQRYGLSRRYVRDTLTKRPGFPAPAMRLSQRLVRWRAGDADKYMQQSSSHSRAAMSAADSR